MLHHPLQRPDRPVMHIGRPVGDIAQRRGLEGVVQFRNLDNGATAKIVAGQADVMKCVVGELPAGMAGDATRRPGKDVDPRFASGLMALASPATQRSNGVVPDTRLRSKVAMALATVSGVMRGFSGNAVAKRPTYS